MFVLCVVRERSLWRADHSSRVLPTVARRCVWSRNLVIRGGHSPRWAAEPEKKILEYQNCSAALIRNPPIDKWRKAIHSFSPVHYAVLWVYLTENQNCPADFRESLQCLIFK
jgi:hypothetical protein